MYVGTDGGRPTGPDGNPDGIIALGLPDTGGGGVWKTTNWLSDSPQWVPLTDGMPSLSVGVHGLAMTTSNPNILYAAADGPQGAILKTTDAGRHWRALAQDLFTGVKFGGIVVSPADPNTIFVAVFRAGTNPRNGAITAGGVYQSTNGGWTWKLILSGETSNIEMDPNNTSTLYAGVVAPAASNQQGVWQSIDGGLTWSSQANRFPAGTFNSTKYIELAIAPSDSQTIYAVVMTPADVPLPRFYSTTTAGAQGWGKICVTASDPDNRFWHQPLMVHPQNPQIVFAEGLNHIGMFTTSGGQGSGSDCTGVWQEFWCGDDPVGLTFYTESPGNLAFAAFGDRGVYRVVNTTHPVDGTCTGNPNNTDFTHKQGNLANPLLVTLQVDPQQPSTLYGIAVDQLSGLTASTATAPFWKLLPIGSEDGKTIVNPNNPTIIYNLCPVDNGCEPDNFITRMTGGQVSNISMGSFNSQDFPFSRAIQTDPGAWKTLEFDPATPEGLLYGGIKVWAWTKTSGMFTALSPPLVNGDQDTNSFISALGIAPSNPNRVYVGTSEGTVFVTSDRVNWNPVSSLSLPADSFVSRIQVNPSNPNQVIIVVQGTTGPGRVWGSNNAGSSWVDLTDNLPVGLQVYTIAIDWARFVPALFIGTDRGVYASMPTLFDGPRWRLFGRGLPNTLISDLEIAPAGALTAAAYGRGAFQVMPYHR